MLTQVKHIRERFIEKFKDQDFEEDGNLEILGASFITDEESIFGKPNAKYQQA